MLVRTLKRLAIARSLATLALLVVPSRAGAQEAMGAEVLFEDGVRLMKAGQFGEACPKIAESQRLEPRAGTLFTLAECLANEGRIATALARYEEYLREFGRMSDDARAKQRGRDKVAEAKRDELKPKVPRLKLVLPSGAPASVRVFKGETELGRAALATWLPVDPGTQTITVETADGRRDTRAELAVGQKLELTLELPTKTQRAEGTANPGTVESEKPKPKSGNKTLGFVALGIGGAGLAVSAVTGFLVLGKKSTIDDNCGIGGDETACNSKGKSAADSAKTLALVSTVSFAVGVVGVGTGAVLVIGASGGEAKSGRGAQVALRGTW
jgi:hypothetical protein